MDKIKKPLMLLIVFVLVFYTADAADDNVNGLCSVTEGGGGTCDASGSCDIIATGQSGTCTDCDALYWPLQGGTIREWNLGSGDCQGDSNCATRCCGDDSNEYPKYFRAFASDGCNDITQEDCTGENDDDSDDACCDSFNDCVLDGVCYSDGGGPADVDGDGVSGSFCYNRPMFSAGGEWSDCDSSEGNCTAAKCGSLDWVQGGESSSFGEYDSGTATECCGDDAGEVSRDKEWDSSGPDGFDVYWGACCNSATDCNDDGQCYSHGTTSQDVEGDGDNDYCNSGTWQDCSTNSQCNTGSGYYCSGGDCINTCTINSNCPSGYFCNSGGTCQAKLADGGTCDGITNQGTSVSEDEACTSGRCDNDGSGLGDDGWCYSIYNALYDSQETSYCEYDTGAAVDIFADERAAHASYDNTGSGSSYLGCPGYSSCMVASSPACQAYDGDATESICTNLGSDWIESNYGDSIIDSTGCSSGVACGNGAGAFCCGDDANENYRYYLVVESSVENGYSDNSSDNACCDNQNDCVLSRACYSSGASADADNNGDDDYCNAGEWVDCSSNDECTSGKICYDYDCIEPGTIRIENLGVTGLDIVNENYTSTKGVILTLTFPPNAVYCRYINGDDPDTMPSAFDNDWTVWETCINSRVWTLTDSPGLKTVFYQMNLTDLSTQNYNDTIYFNYTGAGLDTTPPNPPSVYFQTKDETYVYTNDNQNITVFWYNASDPESEIFGIPLTYHVQLNNDGGDVIGDTYTQDTQYTFDVAPGDRENEGLSVVANVTVINSVGLTAMGESTFLVMDFTGPAITDLNAFLFNKSSSQYLDASIAGEDTFVYSDKANLSWDSYDFNINVLGEHYSYILSKSYLQSPDNIPEGDIDSLNDTLDALFTSLSPGKYYFAIKAKDMAGNWGPASSINFSIDSTPPSMPRIISETKGLDNISYRWSASTDSESGLSYYQINLTDAEGNLNQSHTISSSTTQTIFTGLSDDTNYTAVVYAFNNIGIYSASDGSTAVFDTTPPEISASPTATVITSYPIIRVRTNEDAVCFYNTSAQNIRFTYSNTTYHESRLGYHADSSYEYVITCQDSSLNTAVEYLNFNVDVLAAPDTITPNIGALYEKVLNTFTILIERTSLNLTGINPEYIELSINGKDIELSVNDLGSGLYNISFVAPARGNYTAAISIPGVEEEFDADVRGLRFLTEYYDSGMGSSIVEREKIAYYDGVSRVGMATDTEIDLSTEAFTNRINFSSDVTSDTYIFNTKPAEIILGREKNLENKNLLDLINPSFGYAASDNYLINLILSPDSYRINSGTEKISSGKTSYLVKLRTSQGEKEVYFDE